MSHYAIAIIDTSATTEHERERAKSEWLKLREKSGHTGHFANVVVVDLVENLEILARSFEVARIYHANLLVFYCDQKPSMKEYSFQAPTE